MIYKVRVGKNGRITIPVEIRRNLDLGTGDILMFEHIEGHWTMRKATPEEQDRYDKVAPRMGATP